MFLCPNAFVSEQLNCQSDLNMQDAKSDLLDRANQMILLCRNADQSADQTVITLADQREQLGNIENHLTSMDVKLVETKHDIKRLKGLSERVIDSFRSKFHGRFLSKILHHARKSQDSIDRPHRVSPTGNFLSKINRFFSETNFS